MDFAALKKNRGNKSLTQLSDQLAKVNQKGGGFVDPDADTYWRPTRDAAGNAFAIIRFLPAPADEDIPFVTIYDHGFKGPTGQWYIEKSRTTIGEEDPVSKYNSELWNASQNDDSPQRKQARDQKRRKKYVSGIYVIKDSGNPENNGKVFRYEYGAKIWGKLNDLMNPAFEDEKPVNPFDFWEGANFRLKVTGKGRDTNYDKSEFDSPEPLLDGDDEKLEAIWKSQYSLKELIAPDKFKPYAELEAKLYRVLGLTAGTTSGTASAEEDEPETGLDMSTLGKEEAAPAMKETEAPAPASSSDDDDEDDLAFFKNLAQG